MRCRSGKARWPSRSTRSLRSSAIRPAGAAERAREGRRQLAQDARSLGSHGHPRRRRVRRTSSTAAAASARSREDEGREPWDVLTGIAIADELNTSFGTEPRVETDDDWKARVEIWRDGRAVIGASDAGAHLDLLASFNYATVLLDQAVRERGLLPLEEAVHLITDVPAKLYGLRDRVGWRRAATRTSSCSIRRRWQAIRSACRWTFPGGRAASTGRAGRAARAGERARDRARPRADGRAVGHTPAVGPRHRNRLADLTHQYTHGHHESVLRSHRSRTVENSAAYLIDRLHPGLDVLDVGCGPGTITVDLAAFVLPGQVVGLDAETDIVDVARESAAGVSNVTFRTGDVYALDLPDAVLRHRARAPAPPAPDRSCRRAPRDAASVQARWGGGRARSPTTRP